MPRGSSGRRRNHAARRQALGVRSCRSDRLAYGTGPPAASRASPCGGSGWKRTAPSMPHDSRPSAQHARPVTAAPTAPDGRARSALPPCLGSAGSGCLLGRSHRVCVAVLPAKFVLTTRNGQELHKTACAASHAPPGTRRQQCGPQHSERSGG